MQRSGQARDQSEDARWQALLTRDAAADGSFYYSVRSTGVYCLPSCAARPARPENVDFHATIADAQRAGFRPCKRCRPDQFVPTAQRITASCRAIEASIDSGNPAPSLARLAQNAHLSPSRFHQLFVETTGVTPNAYAAAHRERHMRDALTHQPSVTDAIYAAGFSSSGRFYEESAKRLGMTPSAYRGGAPGLAIRFAVGPWSLGQVLVAATERGVCAILLGDDPQALIDDLSTRFPRATLIGADPSFERTIALVIALVENPRATPSHDLPLDIQGTAFQQRVWQALRKIPVGQTATYTEIAQSIGSPQSVRAVAAACGANPLAVVIPCHRVVRIGGALAGYRWGIERKRELLAREARIKDSSSERA